MKLLGQVCEAAEDVYPHYEFHLVGYPRGGGRPLRLPCPRPARGVEAEDGSNADLILDALAESDGPMTLRELAHAATAGEPTGALRRALKRLLSAGRVCELPGPPKAYDLP